MRQITFEACQAFHNHVAYKSSNTRVIVNSDSDDGVVMELHGNAIAKEILTGPNYGLYVRSAGWETSTTKERLNGFAGVHVVQKAGQWFLNGKKWENTEEWTKVTSKI